MIPKTKDKYVGIEIECYTDKDYDYVNRLKRDFRDILESGHDGSIQVPHSVWSQYSALEFRVLSKENELHSNLKRVGLFLKKINAETNNSCGLHVHIDCRNRNVLDVFSRLVKKQDKLFKMVPYTRRINSFCKKVEDINIFSSERHLAINPRAYNKYKTIEVRLHEGTVDIDEIENWCNFLIKTAENKPLSMDEESYVRRRIRKHS